MLQPIETAPKDGTYVLLFGHSGCHDTPLRCDVCRYDVEYRHLQPWVNYNEDLFLDSGDAPTHWMPLPELPQPRGVWIEFLGRGPSVLDVIHEPKDANLPGTYVWCEEVIDE
jgi:hypothetical protein